MTDTEPDIAADAELDAQQLSRRAAKSIYRRREPLTEAKRAELRGHAERTGVGIMRLLRGARDKPTGMNASIVWSWLAGVVESAVPSHVEYVLARWAALPTNRRLPLTPEMCAELEAEFARTGMVPAQLMKRAKDVPAGLTHQVVQSWTSGESKPGTVGESHWTYVMTRLRSLPDGQARPSRSSKAVRERLTEIDPESLAELRVHRERTGIGATILLRHAPNKPPALTPTMVSSWLSGNVAKADPEFVAFVLACYRAWP